jgi:hypothetical protein
MTNDAELPPDDGLPDLSSLLTVDVLASGDSALTSALRRLAAELAHPAATPVLAAFSNFAPTEPDLP